MSTGNFITMREFPLFVHPDILIKRCPHCGLWQDAEATVCEECGENIEDATEFEHDEFCERELYEEVSEECEELTRRLMFHTVSVRSGYYSGIQLYVEEENDPYDMYNYDIKYMFDCYPSQAKRKFDCEKRKIEREMRRIAKRYGMKEYYVSAAFSNGEVWYREVPGKNATKRERVRYAAAQ